MTLPPSPPAPAARALQPTEIVGRLAQHPGWMLDGDGETVAIRRIVRCEDFHHAMAFANAVAYIAHRLRHPPALQVAATECTVRFRTAAARGLTAADFAAAAQVDLLLAESP
jgi:4a-hydroxytetrahydrobiopterin dehydratase